MAPQGQPIGNYNLHMPSWLIKRASMPLSIDEYADLLEHHIDEAHKELGDKSLLDIQLETALKWTGRACAAAKKDLEHDATEYAHEAIEHAALAGDDDLLNTIRHTLEFYKIKL